MIGTRLDWFDILDKTVLSPRTTFMFKPRSDHTLRRRRSTRRSVPPHFVNSFLDASLGISIGGGITLPVPAVGNPDLKEEALTAYEAGYIGVVGPATVGASVYLNHTDDMILFIPAGQRDRPPIQFTYLKVLTCRPTKGSSCRSIRQDIATFVNYSWQATPDAKEIG